MREIVSVVDSSSIPSLNVSGGFIERHFAASRESSTNREAPVHVNYLVNGKVVEWKGARQEVTSPNYRAGETPQLLGSYPLLTEKESLAAVNAAFHAFNRGLGVWPRMPLEERISAIEKFVACMRERREEVVALVSIEISKTRADAEKEFDRTIQYINESLEAARNLSSSLSRSQTREGIVSTQQLAPRGVTLCVGPFNYPLNESFTTLIPALLMGNTTILKTPKYGTLLFSPLLSAFAECFPPGTVNVISGDGAATVGEVVKSGKIDVLAFIGSTRVASILIRQHPEPHRLKVILGLGAKNPGIVLHDADLDKAVKECVIGALSYNGQRCTALKVLFVHRSISDKFAAKIAAAVSTLKMGMPWEEGVSVTPLVEDGKGAYLRELIEDAAAHGARVMNEGGGSEDGKLFTPAVLYPVAHSARIAREEQFGPVVPIVPYDDISEVVEWQAATPFKQQVSLFGSDEATLNEIGEVFGSLVARVNFNTGCQRGPDILPFTGKENSAMGTLSIEEALKEFSIPVVFAKKGR